MLILLSTARFVLSMNWEQSSKFSATDNELIYTACSPKPACEEVVNNQKAPIESMRSWFQPDELFTANADEK